MNQTEMAEVLTMVDAAWPRDRPDGWHKVWAAALYDLPGPEAKLAVQRLIRTESFPPSIAQVRLETAAELGLLMSTDSSVVVQWCEAVQQALFTHAVTFPDPPSGEAEAAVRAFGGYEAVLNDREGFRAFLRRYADNTNRDVVAGAMTHAPTLAP